MERVYFDYAATTSVDPEVARAMAPYLSEKFGNASSAHGFGQEARRAVEDSRQTVAGFLGAKPEEIVFTSGGTESDNWALFGVASALAKKGNHIITSRIEHHAILEPASALEKKGFKVTRVPVDSYGRVDPAEVKKAITAGTILISVMHANNEVGTIEPIAEIGAIAREKGIYFHTDAVQTVGHIPVDVNELNVDLLSFSSHKFYGPKGSGGMFIRKGTRIDRFLYGGEQERGRRGSTYNTPGIVGMARALELCAATMEKEARFQVGLRERFLDKVRERIPHCALNGHPSQRLPNNINVSFRGIEGESLLLNLDMLGFAVSTGSACSSESLEPSHVLMAMGLTHEIAHSSLRISLGRWSTQAQLDSLLERLVEVVSKLRAMSPVYSKE